MSIPLFQVDAFTSQPFQGNPAGVCFLDQPMPEARMQSVAAEMNLSETAFLLPESDGFRLRWFTPAVEVDLCGHATLASAHALWQSGRLPAGQMARFHTRSGLLTAQQVQVEGQTWIELNFPANPVKTVQPPVGLLESLGLQAKFVGRSKFDYLIEASDESTVRSLHPDFEALKKIDVRGVIVTSRSTQPGVDFISRFFAPRVGVPEDPVTGSAHTSLAPFWADRLRKERMCAHQVSARGGILWVHMDGERVRIAGQAVTVFCAELLL